MRPLSNSSSSRQANSDMFQALDRQQQHQQQWMCLPWQQQQQQGANRPQQTSRASMR
jgi:hypothetical protein